MLACVVTGLLGLLLPAAAVVIWDSHIFRAKERREKKNHLTEIEETNRV